MRDYYMKYLLRKINFWHYVALTIIGLLLVISVTSFAADAQNTKTVSLNICDLEKKEPSFFQYSNAKAKFTVIGKSTEQNHNGRFSLKLGWDFGNSPNNGDFIALGVNFRTPGFPQTYEFWLYADKPNLNLGIRLRDTSGEIFQRDVCKIDWDGWRKIIIPAEATSIHWGGDKNGTLNLPLTLDSIVFSWTPDGKAAGTAYLDGLSVNTVVDENNPSNAISLNYLGKRFLQIGSNSEFSFAVKQIYKTKFSLLTAEAKIFQQGSKIPYAKIDKKIKADTEILNFSLPTPNIGSARLEIQLSTPDGKCIETMIINDLTVLPDVSTGKFDPESIFGICQKSSNCDSIGACGIKWIRIDVNYAPPEWYPDKSFEQTTSSFKKTVDSAYDNKIMTLAILNPRRFLLTCRLGGTLPSKLNSLDSFAHGSYKTLNYNEKEPSLLQWGDWVYRMVSTFKDKVKYWEIANEPDLATSPQQYTAINNIAYIMAKKADPNCMVGGFSTAGVDLTFIEECLKSGMTDYFDFVSVHPYQWCHSFSPKVMKSQLNGLESLLKKYRCNRPVWLTEFGWPTQSQGGVSHILQADLLKQLLLTCAALEQYKIFWYCNSDWQGATTDQEANFGIFDGTGRPKPSFWSYCGIARLLAGARSLGELELTPGVHGYRYLLKDGKTAIGLWSDHIDTKVNLELPEIDGSSAMLQKANSSMQSLVVQNKELTLKIDRSPVLLIYSSSKIPKVCNLPAIAEIPAIRQELFIACPAIPQAVPGEEITIPFSIINKTGTGITAKPALTLPPEWRETVNANITASSGMETIGKIDIKIPDNAIPGKHLLELRYGNSNRVLLNLTVNTPLVFDIFPCDKPLRKGIPLILNVTNLSGIRQHGRLAVKCGTASNILNVDVPPRQQQQMSVKLPDNINSPNIEAEIMLSGRINGNDYKIINRLDCTYIPQAVSPVIIDGNWDKWNSIHGFHLCRRNQAKPLAVWWQGENDLSGEIKLQWDSLYLYLAARVKDNVHFQPSVDGGTWLGDGFQLSFGINNEYAFELLLADTSVGGQLYMLKSPTGHVGFLSDARVLTKSSGCYTLYEAAIPWKSIPGVYNEKEAKISFNFILNDNDGAGRKGWLECRPGIGESKSVSENYKWELGR
ncbi:MAG: sugar-binding protein [Victivallaceae bacterium]